MAKIIRGRVPNDGNGRIGGDWLSATYLCSKWVSIESITDDEAVASWLANRVEDDAVEVQAYLNSGYDHSVGCYSYCEVYEVLESDLLDAINDCPLLTDDEREKMVEKYEDIVWNTDDYESDEEDY